jgi:hypothetical protein
MGVRTMCRRCGAVLMLCACVAVARADEPKYDETDVQGTELVRAVATQDVPPKAVDALAVVCDRTARVYREALGLRGPETIRLYVSAAKHYWTHITTDRVARVFAVVRGAEDVQVGQSQHRLAGPVGLVCQATGELFNSHQVPGLQRYVASLLAVPALDKELGVRMWPTAYGVDAVDGPTAFRRRSGDPRFLRDHPDHAAAYALAEVAAALGTPWLGRQLRALQTNGAEAMAALHVAAVQADPKLHAAFRPWDDATDLGADQPEGVLVNTFDTAEDLGRLNKPYQVTWLASGTWHTDGRRSLTVTFAANATYPGFTFLNDDWRFRDWSTYSTFELDVRNPGAKEIVLVVEAYDHAARGHGSIALDVTVPAGEAVHVSMPLVPPARERACPNAVCYDGHFRVNQVAHFGFLLRSTGPEPVVLQFDNLRLMP